MINYYYASIFLLLIIKISTLQHPLPKKVSKYIIIGAVTTYREKSSKKRKNVRGIVHFFGIIEI